MAWTRAICRRTSSASESKNGRMSAKKTYSQSSRSKSKSSSACKFSMPPPFSSRFLRRRRNAAASITTRRPTSKAYQKVSRRLCQFSPSKRRLHTIFAFKTPVTHMRVSLPSTPHYFFSFKSAFCLFFCSMFVLYASFFGSNFVCGAQTLHISARARLVKKDKKRRVFSCRRRCRCSQRVHSGRQALISSCFAPPRLPIG